MIPVNEPAIGDEERGLVDDALRTGWISSSGRYIEQFEQSWASYCGRRYGVAVNNGTSALIAAVAAAGLQPGDEIILPSFTIISCALAAVYNGLTPVFVDVDPRTYTMTPEGVERAISPRTRAIMPVHIYGHPCDMDPLLELADRRELLVIEDAAEAHGAQYRGRRCGSFGAMSCFSFYANKIITTGEGGMVLTDDDELAARLRSFRNLCFGARERFRHESLGQNFRMTNLQAAIGVAQVHKVEAFLTQKRLMAARYDAGLRGLQGVTLPTPMSWASSVYWMYAIEVAPETGLTAEALAAELRSRGVETRPFFLGLHAQPALAGIHKRGSDEFPVTDRIYRQGLYLPSGLALTEAQIGKVVAAVREAFSSPTNHCQPRHA